MKLKEGTTVHSKNLNIDFEGTICGFSSFSTEIPDSGTIYIIKILSSTINKKMYPYSCITVPECNLILYLYPTSYSQFKTVKSVMDCIKNHRKQDTNNALAYKYSVEFVTHEDAPVGTLSEYNFSNFKIILLDCSITIKKINNEFHVETFDYK